MTKLKGGRLTALRFWSILLCITILLVGTFQQVTCEVEADETGEFDTEEGDVGYEEAEENDNEVEEYEEVGDEDDDDEYAESDDIEDDEQVLEDDDAVPSLPGNPLVSLVPWILNKQPEPTIEIGLEETLSVLCGVINDAETPVTVKSITGVLNTADMKYLLQNLSEVKFDQTIGPGDEMTFSYDVKVKDKRDGVKAIVLLGMYLSEDDEEYSRLFLNQTIELVEQPSTSNAFTYFIATIIICLVSILLISAVRGMGTSGSVETGPRSGGFEGKDWIDNYNDPQGASGLRKRR